MILSAILAASLAPQLPPPTAIPPPPPAVAILWAKPDGANEIIQVALLDVMGQTMPTIPTTLYGKLYQHGQGTPVELHLISRSSDDPHGDWVSASYAMTVPEGVSGDVVLSLSSSEQGWFFRLGRP